MIFDNIKNKELYLSINEGFKVGFDFIQKVEKENLPIGKYEIDGKKVWASVQEYLSKDEAKAEAHRNYIDIQYIISGKEIMLNANIDLCKSKVEYNSDKDVEFFEPCQTAKLECGAGDFAIFFPTDVHTPGLKVNENTPVRKVVIKVRV